MAASACVAVSPQATTVCTLQEDTDFAKRVTRTKERWKLSETGPKHARQRSLRRHAATSLGEDAIWPSEAIVKARPVCMRMQHRMQQPPVALRGMCASGFACCGLRRMVVMPRIVTGVLACLQVGGKLADLLINSAKVTLPNALDDQGQPQVSCNPIDGSLSDMVFRVDTYYGRGSRNTSASYESTESDGKS